MKTKEVRNLDDDQLVDKVKEFREELFSLRFRNATGELENTARMREARETIEADPNVEALQAAFDATLEPDSIRSSK